MKHKPNFKGRYNNNRKHNKTGSTYGEAIKLDGLSVTVRGDDINYALRKFKKKVQESGILQDLREKEHYTKPSEANKKAKAAARARWLKKLNSDPVAKAQRDKRSR